jgi:cellulose synthase/poly-beta-1,6-N-acetylglucosamine synthase-like glycosyltransferase
MSARTHSALWQRLAAVIVTVAILAALLLAPLMTIWAITLSLALVLVPVIALRLVAAYGLLTTGTEDQEIFPRVPDHELPIYTLLVPLYREAHMLPPLVAALTRLDYPAAKLDIKLILEAADRPTIDAARALRCSGNIEIVVVPDLQPRTKPKALNYALPLARGDYVVIYDAEDRPEPGPVQRHRGCRSRHAARAQRL